MGNCLRSNKVLAQDHENYEAKVVDAKVEKVINWFSLCKLEAATPRMRSKSNIKKKVRFNMQNDDDDDDDGSGSVRIRVVMTQEELKRMLRCKDETQNCSLEQLLHAVKLRGGRVSEVGDEGNSWKPSLDSIPEDRLINFKYSFC